MKSFISLICCFFSVIIAQGQLAKLDKEDKTFTDEDGMELCVKNLVLKQGNTKKVIETFQAPCGGNVEEGSDYNLITSQTGNLQAFNSLEEGGLIIFNRQAQTLTRYENHFGTPLFFSDDDKYLYGTNYDQNEFYQGLYGDDNYFSVYRIELATSKSKMIKWASNAKKRTDGHLDITLYVEAEDNPLTWEQTTKTYDKNLNPIQNSSGQIKLLKFNNQPDLRVEVEEKIVGEITHRTLILWNNGQQIILDKNSSLTMEIQQAEDGGFYEHFIFPSKKYIAFSSFKRNGLYDVSMGLYDIATNKLKLYSVNKPTSLGNMSVSSDETIIYFHQQFGYGDFFSSLNLTTGKKTDIEETVSNIKMATNGNIILTLQDEEGNETTKTYDKYLNPLR